MKRDGLNRSWADSPNRGEVLATTLTYARDHRGTTGRVTAGPPTGDLRERQRGPQITVLINSYRRVRLIRTVHSWLESTATSVDVTLGGLAAILLVRALSDQHAVARIASMISHLGFSSSQYAAVMVPAKVHAWLLEAATVLELPPAQVASLLLALALSNRNEVDQAVEMVVHLGLEGAIELELGHA